MAGFDRLPGYDLNIPVFHPEPAPRPQVINTAELVAPIIKNLQDIGEYNSPEAKMKRAYLAQQIADANEERTLKLANAREQTGLRDLALQQGSSPNMERSFTIGPDGTHVTFKQKEPAAENSLWQSLGGAGGDSATPGATPSGPPKYYGNVPANTPTGYTGDTTDVGRMSDFNATHTATGLSNRDPSLETVAVGGEQAVQLTGIADPKEAQAALLKKPVWVENQTNGKLVQTTVEESGPLHQKGIEATMALHKKLGSFDDPNASLRIYAYDPQARRDVTGATERIAGTVPGAALTGSAAGLGSLVPPGSVPPPASLASAPAAPGAIPVGAPATAQNAQSAVIQTATKAPISSEALPETIGAGPGALHRLAPNSNDYIDRAGKITTIHPTKPEDGKFKWTGDAGDIATATSVANYDADLNSLRRNPEYYTNLLEEATKINPNFNAAKYAERSALRKSYQSGDDHKRIQSLNTAVSHLSHLAEAGAALNNPGNLGQNTVRNWLKQTFGLEGKDALASYKTAQEAVAGEMASVFKASGATQKEIDEWKKNFNSNYDKGQLQGSLKEAGQLIGGRLNTLSSTYRDVMGGMDYPVLNNDSRQILKGFGYDAAPVSQQDRDTLSGTPPTPATLSPSTAGAAQIPSTSIIGGVPFAPEGGGLNGASAKPPAAAPGTADVTGRTVGKIYPDAKGNRARYMGLNAQNQPIWTPLQ